MKKQMPWFRFYTEALDDPKVQRLPPHLFKTWINLLCLAGANGGKFPSVDDIAFRLRMSAHDVQQQIDELILAGLIDIGNDGKREPHNWMKRQFLSDTSTERVRKHREKKEKHPCNAGETLHETPPDTDPDPETESETKSSLTEQDAAREKRSEEILNGLGLGRGGPVTAEGRRKVCARLAIANADPLVALYEAWPRSQTAKDPDGLFISQAAKFYREAEPEVKAACQPLAPAAPVPIAPAAIPRPSSQLAERLRMRTH